jgi:predicted amidohydrolase YtcJ
MLEKKSLLQILQNGRIYPFDDRFTSVESIAIQNDRILAVGFDHELSSLCGSDAIVHNLGGMTVLPGLTDAHIHIKGLAQKEAFIDCETGSLQECLARIETRIADTAHGQWIQGQGWNQNVWDRFGTADDLDRLTGDHPIYLVAKSGHAAWVNSSALALAGIHSSTPDPEGGEIQRDCQGNATGILFENAMRLVSDLVPAPSEDDLQQWILTTQEQLWRYGLTGFHDFDGVSSFRVLQRLLQEDRLGMRVLKNFPLPYLDQMIELGLKTGFGDPWLKIGSVKIFSDGALGPQTAAMLEPYQGQSDNCGILLIDENELRDILCRASSHGISASIHAIGDRANRVVLNAFQKLREMEKGTSSPHLRHRIEHLQLLHPEDIHRPVMLHIAASMQPIHATSDMFIADQYWGSRSRYSYAWRSLLDEGTVLAFGSDAPVESANPFLGLHAAVTRCRPDAGGSVESWTPEERISIKDALKAYTLGPAYLSGLGDLLGQLLPGYLADLIVLDTDPFQCQVEQLPYLSPVATMVGGEWRFCDF